MIENESRGKAWVDADLNGFENLASISSFGNSPLSNVSPFGKVDTYSKIINQSQKFEITVYITKNIEWNKDNDY